MKIQILSRFDEGRGLKKAIGMKILEPPRNGKHNFRKDWLQQWREFITVTDGKIVLHTVDGDVSFKIIYAPGRHCLTCGEVLPDAGADPHAEQCRSHIEEHGEVAVKTERWPHGYIATKAYMTILEE